MRFFHLDILRSKLTVIGNMKCDFPLPALMNRNQWAKRWQINTNQKTIVCGSTHEKEEIFFYKTLAPLLETYQINLLIAPRHPDRFLKVKKMMNNLPHVTVIDQIGVLASCYCFSDIAIIGGSFFPGVGGHDFLESMKLEALPICGPYMESQGTIVKKVTEKNGLFQIRAEDLYQTIHFFLKNEDEIEKVQKRNRVILKELLGASEKGWKIIKEEGLKSLLDTFYQVSDPAD